jgi:hypothetical protein
MIVGGKTSVRREHRADRRAGRLTPLRLRAAAIRSVAAISLCGRAIAYGSAVNDGVIFRLPPVEPRQARRPKSRRSERSHKATSTERRFRHSLADRVGHRRDWQAVGSDGSEFIRRVLRSLRLRGSPGCRSGSTDRSCCGFRTGRSWGRCQSYRPGCTGSSLATVAATVCSTFWRKHQLATPPARVNSKSEPARCCNSSSVISPRIAASSRCSNFR